MRFDNDKNAGTDTDRDRTQARVRLLVQAWNRQILNKLLDKEKVAFLASRTTPTKTSHLLCGMSIQNDHSYITDAEKQ